jgi:hypothetical protein
MLSEQRHGARRSADQTRADRGWFLLGDGPVTIGIAGTASMIERAGARGVHTPLEPRKGPRAADRPVNTAFIYARADEAT